MTPSPEYPVWHMQEKDPLVFVQLASTWQLSDPVVHSSMSGVNEMSFGEFVATCESLFGINYCVV